MIHRHALALAASAMLATAAAAQQDSTAASAAPVIAPATVPAPRAPRARRSRTLITREEIQTRSETDLFTLIYTIRPHWMQPRGKSYLRHDEFLQVYVNNQRSDGTAILRQIQPQNVESIRYLDSVEAASQLGANHGIGAILVTLR
jgi:hypothetical protein